MTIPKVCHQILLVGSNPLPNAVAGKVLVETGGEITLIHSEDSYPVANNLKRWLEEEHTVTVRFKQVDKSDPGSIFRGVQQVLEGKSCPFGLNYTGGTKMMSVHAFRAVEEWARNNDVEAVFSYLDADTLEMVFDPTKGRVRGQRYFAGQILRLRIQDLLRLHGWDYEKEPNTKPVFPETAKALARCLGSDEEFRQHWNNWWGKKDWKSWGAPNNMQDGWEPENEVQKGVYQILRRELASENAIIKPGSKAFQDWMTGKWLEHYVLNMLNELAEELQLVEQVQNLETKPIRFDLDVSAIRGYQLFVFSCKVSKKKKDLKIALFEAYVRAQQVGGDEARVALVCCSEEPEIVEEEMKRELSLKGQVRVFGRKHLKNLDSYIKDWIESQIGGE